MNTNNYVAPCSVYTMLLHALSALCCSMLCVAQRRPPASPERPPPRPPGQQNACGPRSHRDSALKGPALAKGQTGNCSQATPHPCKARPIGRLRDTLKQARESWDTELGTFSHNNSINRPLTPLTPKCTSSTITPFISSCSHAIYFKSLSECIEPRIELVHPFYVFIL